MNNVFIYIVEFLFFSLYRDKSRHSVLHVFLLTLLTSNLAIPDNPIKSPHDKSDQQLWLTIDKRLGIRHRKWFDRRWLIQVLSTCFCPCGTVKVATYLAISEFGFRRIWRILQIPGDVIHLALRPWWITLSEICSIPYILRKPNSIIVLLFIQNNSKFKIKLKRAYLGRC